MIGLVKQAPGREHVGLAEVERPSPGQGQVLLEVIATGVCGTDLHIVDDEFPSRPPVVMGHEVSGRVIEVGPGVDTARIDGRRYATETYAHTCERCAQCRSGHRNLCPERRSIGSHMNGGFASHVVVPELNLHPVAVSLGEHSGALYEPLACVAQCLCDPSVASPGDRALVVGPGTMGLLAAQVLRAQGAEVTVVGAERDAGRLALAERLGLRALGPGPAPGPAERLGLRALGPGPAPGPNPAGLGPAPGPGAGEAGKSGVQDESFDVVADCSGSATGIDLGLRSVRKGGRYIQIGLAGRPIPIPIDLITLHELTVTSGFASTPRSWRRAVALVEGGHVQLDPLVTAAYPLSGWQEAFERTRRADGVKLVIDPRLEG